MNLPLASASQPQEAGAVTACGDKLADSTGYPSALYKGERVYFCTKACYGVFLSDSDRFMAGEIPYPTETE